MPEIIFSYSSFQGTWFSFRASSSCFGSLCCAAILVRKLPLSLSRRRRYEEPALPIDNDLWYAAQVQCSYDNWRYCL